MSCGADGPLGRPLMLRQRRARALPGVEACVGGDGSGVERSRRQTRDRPGNERETPKRVWEAVGYAGESGTCWISFTIGSTGNIEAIARGGGIMLRDRHGR